MKRPNVVSATPVSHFSVTPISGDGYSGLGNKSTTMGQPVAMSSDRSWTAPSSAMPGPTKKSKPDVPDAPTCWQSKGYNMSLPTTWAEGRKIANEMKAH